MIVLDTNVVSELLKPTPDPAVQKWANGIESGRCVVSSPTSYEIVYGIQRLPQGRRRQFLIEGWASLCRDFLQGRVWPVDHEATACAGERRATLVANGTNRDICDLLIFGIAKTRGAAIATRNVRHFDDLPVTLIDPWAQS